LNVLEISSNACVGHVFGGYVECGEAKSNVVEISRANVWSASGGTVGVCSGKVTSNEVRISTANVGYVYGGHVGYGEAKSNVVKISSNARMGKVSGGETDSGGGVEKNRVDIISASVGDVY
jgi:hypothetical protein